MIIKNDSDSWLSIRSDQVTAPMIANDMPPAAQIRAGFADWSVRLPRLGIREGALRLGVSEGALAGALCGLDEEIGIVSCSRLEGPIAPLVAELAAAGGLLATFGDRQASVAVLAADATCEEDGEALRLGMGPLRLVLPQREPVALIAVREARGCRCGTLELIGLYAADGRPLLRLHRTSNTDPGIYARAIAARTTAGSPRFTPTGAVRSTVARLLAPLDVQRLRAGWLAAADGAAIEDLLERMAGAAGTDRLRLLDGVGAPYARRIDPLAMGRLLDAACAVDGGGFELRCAFGEDLRLPAGGRHACEGREHLVVVEDLCLRLAHDGIAEVRALRYPGAAGPQAVVEVYDPRRRRTLALRPIGAAAPAWSAAVEQAACAS